MVAAYTLKNDGGCGILKSMYSSQVDLDFYSRLVIVVV